MTTFLQILDWCLHGGPIAALCCLAGGVLLLVCLIDTMLRRAMPALAIIVIGAVFQLELDTAVSADVLPSPLTPRVAGLLIAGIPVLSLGVVLLVSRRFAGRPTFGILAAAAAVACCLGLVLGDGPPESRALLLSLSFYWGNLLAFGSWVIIFENARELALSPLTPKPWRFTAEHWRAAKRAEAGPAEQLRAIRAREAPGLRTTRRQAALPALALTVALFALLHAGLAVSGPEGGLMLGDREFGPLVSWSVQFAAAVFGWLAALFSIDPDDPPIERAAFSLLLSLLSYASLGGLMFTAQFLLFPDGERLTDPWMLAADFAAGAMATAFLFRRRAREPARNPGFPPDGPKAPRPAAPSWTPGDNPKHAPDELKTTTPEPPPEPVRPAPPPLPAAPSPPDPSARRRRAEEERRLRARLRAALSVLGLKGTPSRMPHPAAVAAAHRRLAEIYRPDRAARLGGDFRRAAEDKMRAIDAARDLLVQHGAAASADNSLTE